MTTAVRLPDQFSPGAAATNAATPTCCRCCCCCAVSSVGAAVHIPEALYQDTKTLEQPRSALVVPAAVYPLLVVLLPFATATHVAVVAVPYLGGALAFGYYLFRRYRSKK